MGRKKADKDKKTLYLSNDLIKDGGLLDEIEQLTGLNTSNAVEQAVREYYFKIKSRQL